MPRQRARHLGGGRGRCGGCHRREWIERGNETERTRLSHRRVELRLCRWKIPGRQVRIDGGLVSERKHRVIDEHFADVTDRAEGVERADPGDTDAETTGAGLRLFASSAEYARGDVVELVRRGRATTARDGPFADAGAPRQVART